MMSFTESSREHLGGRWRVHLRYLRMGGPPLLLAGLSLVALALFHASLRIIGIVVAGYVAGVLPLAVPKIWRSRWVAGSRRSVPSPIRTIPRRAPWVPVLTEPPIGRSRELHLIEEFLRSRGGVRPQTIVIKGPPGAGKTSIAAYAALQAAEMYPDDQVFVQFDARFEKSRVAKAVLTSLIADLQGLDEEIPASIEGLEKTFASITENQSLIVIADGISQPELAHTIMSAGRRCLIFFTAERLTLSTDRALVVDVEGLSISDALKILENRVGSDRVTEEPEAAKEIVKAAALNPLAIRLIGSSIAEGPYWSLALANERLIEKIQIFGNYCPGDIASTEIGLSVALEICYDRLAEDERKAVSLLALLDNPIFSAWMLAALLGSSSNTASNIIDGLLRAGLLERVSADATGVQLLRARQQVRNYAERKLLAETDQSYRDERCARLFKVQEERHRADVSRSTVGAILLTHEVGDFNSALAKARDSIALARDQKDQPSEALALAALAEIQAELGYTGEADELAETARQIGGQDSQPRALRVLGKVRRRWRQLEAAEKYLHEGLQLAESNFDSPEVTRILRELAAVQAEGSTPETALQTAHKATESASRQNDTMSLLIAGTRWAEGRALLRLHRYEASEEALSHALRDAFHSGQRMWQAWIYHELGRVQLERGNIVQAQHKANSALNLFAGMRHRYGGAYCRKLLGEIYFTDGRLNHAARVLDEALDTFQNCGDPWIEAETSRMLAKVRVSQDRSRDALRLLDNAAATFADLDDLLSLSRVQIERAASKRQQARTEWRTIRSRVGLHRSTL